MHSESTRSRWSRADIVSAACRPAQEAQNGPLDDAYEVQASGSVGSRHTHSGVCGGVVERTPRPRSCVRRCCARPLGLLGHLEMDADRPDVGRRSTGLHAQRLRIIEDTYARHAGAIGSVAGASRAAGLIRADRADFLSEGGQARPERFETAIYGLARAIDSTLGGRGRLARWIQANSDHVIRLRP